MTKQLIPIEPLLLSDRIISYHIPRWINTEEEPPDTPRKVLVTDGLNIGTAHWDTQNKQWMNQKVISGLKAIDDELIPWIATHWMDIENLLFLPAE